MVTTTRADVEGDKQVFASNEPIVEGTDFAPKNEEVISNKVDPGKLKEKDEENPFGPWMLVRKPIRRKFGPKLHDGLRSSYYGNHMDSVVPPQSRSRFDALSDEEEMCLDITNTHVGTSKSHSYAKPINMNNQYKAFKVKSNGVNVLIEHIVQPSEEERELRLAQLRKKDLQKPLLDSSLPNELSVGNNDDMVVEGVTPHNCLGVDWFLSVVYDSPQDSLSEELWTELRRFSANVNSPCAACGGLLYDDSRIMIKAFQYNLGVCSSIKAELWGLLHRLIMVKSCNVEKLIVDMDSFVAINLVKGWGDTRWAGEWTQMRLSKRKNAGLVTFHRFGFIRYHGVKDSHALEGRFDNIRLNGCKLWVNLSRFDLERRFVKCMTPKCRKKMTMKPNGHMTELAFQPSDLVVTNLNRCYVGTLHEGLAVENMKEEFVVSGAKAMTVTHMREDKVLLSTLEAMIAKRRQSKYVEGDSNDGSGLDFESFVPKTAMGEDEFVFARQPSE
ncbi:hypothetical protein RIF29_39108 [Crotalaria pallida]|uniref:RNase H type-1 domain-containing protein n=1 Tax=Crotalaria pallida TaxID=3830 RepID=A0AAN9E0L9_CROPI